AHDALITARETQLPRSAPQQVLARIHVRASDTRDDPLCNFNRQLERRRPLNSRNAWLASGACAFDERDELTFERFFAFDLDLIARYPSSGAAIDLTALILIIERKIRVLLKDPNLAHALGTDTARSNVCHAAILEAQPRVRDVFTAAQNRHAHRIDLFHGRTHEMQNDFEIMDHKSENHNDIGITIRI